ncbi:hypothetical protein [Tunturiibacter gelidoferens]|uniref:Uncharacterized protein n=1 Tax=Tunturiibacter lichenicola TaxID=2051959 RepID=A0A7Y9T8B2_9BACT|nr:hypothetical protein [Edaphobacter lichenicola]NYF50355.1 hypothetical protein [Edaphobacter lichenicola]
MGHRAKARSALLKRLTPNTIRHHLSSKKTATTIATPLQHERRRQIRGLLTLAALILLFSVLRAGVHPLFHPGWWRLW